VQEHATASFFRAGSAFLLGFFFDIFLGKVGCLSNRLHGAI
jgi:hypothetical protein